MTSGAVLVILEQGRGEGERGQERERERGGAEMRAMQLQIDNFAHNP